MLAVADATVVKIRDGIPEHRGTDRVVAITVESATGNAVFLDLGANRYAFYAHLIPGSIVVKEGERVRAGQVLGKLGHSGNSDAPHLHFHVCTAPTGLECEGVPFVFKRFDSAPSSSEGNGLEQVIRQTADARARNLVLPEDGTLVTFPNGNGPR